MNEKPYRVRRDEAATGDLPVPGGKSMFRILLDEESVGAKQFALLVNEFDPGLTSKAHKHDKEEHAFYIISGTGIIWIEDEPIEVAEGDAVFVPPGKMHEVSSTGDEILKYIVIYAPPGPNVTLREKGAYSLSGE
ncbi:MAG: cupin domain-containing protein [Nitrospinota bacterium]